MPDETALDHPGGGQPRSRAADRAISALATRQHGVVSRGQLLNARLGRRAIDRRIERGALHPVHRGVYAVGHRALGKHGCWMAAVLAAGADAVLSHRSAAAAWGLRPTDRARIEVTVPRKPHQRQGLQIHHAVLTPGERTALERIPVTTVARTLWDLAAVLPPRQLERAARQAEVLRLFDARPLADLALRHPRGRGSAAVRGLLAGQAIGRGVTRSELEDRFLDLLEDAGLPGPEVNAPLWIAGRWIEVDCLWRSAGLVVELDSRSAHATVASFESDRARDRALLAHGWRVVRITWRQLHEDAAGVLADLRALGEGTSRAPG